ncbi:hypothetical protein ACFWFU_06975 [Streptomyces sp. NPDC060235]|uniref:hypothetical protein n=1 Tax=Streptomyces sp. NPDC060235 TaxID=3347080 RepID=UPI003653BBE8
MDRKKQAEEEPEERSGMAGVLVLAVLTAIVVAVVFRVSATVGILALWIVGAFALWRAARRRMSDSSATPPTPTGGTVYAAHRYEVDRVQEGPGEGLTILYPVRGEETTGP